MPHKFNTSRRHKFAKKRYRVTNWAEYTEILRRRGDLTIWVTDDTLKQWRAPRRTTPGGQPKYSNIAIETCLTLRTIYKLPLRQTQGLMRSIARLMGVDIPVPDFSTLSRRGLGLRLPAKPRVDRTEPIHLTMDSTGLKIFGEGEWLQVKHETKAKRKSWRKLHLGLDLTTGEIICSDLTLDHVGDSTALPGLLDQFDGPVSRFLADGAYDGTPTRNLLTARFGDAVEVIIPPPKNAVLALKSRDDPSLRDQHIAQIQTYGRLAWQVRSGYNQRSRAEAQIGRWKSVIGPKLRSRRFENQKTEAQIGVRALNRMTELGCARFESVGWPFSRVRVLRACPVIDATRPYKWAYIFGAVCPERAAAAALVMPFADTQAMNEHLAEIAKTVVPGAHAVIVLDGAGWHGSKALCTPDNITLLPLPPYAPELNPIENVWAYLRANKLATSIFDSYDHIVEKCCDAWNFFAEDKETVQNIT